MADPKGVAVQTDPRGFGLHGDVETFAWGFGHSVSLLPYFGFLWKPFSRADDNVVLFGAEDFAEADHLFNAFVDDELGDGLLEEKVFAGGHPNATEFVITFVLRQRSAGSNGEGLGSRCGDSGERCGLFNNSVDLGCGAVEESFFLACAGDGICIAFPSVHLTCRAFSLKTMPLNMLTVLRKLVHILQDILRVFVDRGCDEVEDVLVHAVAGLVVAEEVLLGLRLVGGSHFV